jgi:hypothetical protein
MQKERLQEGNTKRKGGKKSIIDEEIKSRGQEIKKEKMQRRRGEEEETK